MPISRTAALLGSFALAGAAVIPFVSSARGQAAATAKPAAPASEAATSSAVEPTMIRDGFETARPIWNQEQTDATIHLLEHDRSRRAAP